MKIEDFETMFREEVMPMIAGQYESNGSPDYPARREAWNDMIDGYVNDGILHHSALDVGLPDDLDN